MLVEPGVLRLAVTQFATFAPATNPQVSPSPVPPASRSSAPCAPQPGTQDSRAPRTEPRWSNRASTWGTWPCGWPGLTQRTSRGVQCVLFRLNGMLVVLR